MFHLADLRLAESGRIKPREDGIAVRDYPFPYHAALAVNNDLDSMTLAAFEDWHGFVNGRGATPYGDGLGLEVADSFWVWGPPGSLALHRQYPKDRPREDSPDLDRIVELGRLGWFDTIHSLTGFDSRPTGSDMRIVSRSMPHNANATVRVWVTDTPSNDSTVGLARDDICYGLDRIRQLGLKPTLYVEHSNAITNIAGPWPWFQRGDDPTNDAYCLDLLKQFGVRFFWLGPAREMDKFGDHLDYKGEPQLREALAQYDWADWMHSRVRTKDGEFIPVPLALPEGEEAKRTLLTGFFNRTISIVTAQDQGQILIFKRFRGTDPPSATNFATQASWDRLNALEARRGVVIIYQHFGNWSLIGRGRKPGARRPSTVPVFDAHGVACWQDIAERQRAGRLFVAAAGRLLNYLWLRERLAMSVERGEERWHVALHGTDCPVLGHNPISTAEVNGLSLLVPESAPEIVVTIDGQSAPLALARTPDPSFPGYHALHRPWRALEWPER